MTRRFALTASLIAISVAFAGCTKTPADAADGASPGAAASGGAETAKVAPVHCPAKVRTAARPAGAPVDDVVGVRPGLTYDEAANLVQCEDRTLAVEPTTTGFQIETYGQRLRQGFNAKPKAPEMSSQEILKKMQDDAMARGSNRLVDPMKPGEQTFYVSTIGPPGQDRVIGVWREQWFAEGRNPPLATVTDALAKKYGTPSLQDGEFVYWLFDPMGRQMGRDAPALNGCRGKIGSTSNNFSLSPDCGLSVAARIVPLKTNPDLARSLELGIADQAKGYAAIEQTEKALAAADVQRRAGEVKRANQTADAPKL